MTTWVKRTVMMGLLAACVAAGRGSADAQARPNRPRANAVPPPGADAGVSPGEIQRLFDAYVVMQAQQELGLSDEQYPGFLGRVKALQDLRRRTEVERTRRMQILRRTAIDLQSSDDELRTQLTQLEEFKQRTSADLQRAEEAVDQTLSVRQQARFHLFLEAMERRKVELLMRARQAKRGVR